MASNTSKRNWNSRVKKTTGKSTKPISPKKIKEALKETNSVIDTIKDVISKDMLVFSREEAGWILDITHDYIQMVKHTRATSEEIKKWYESFLKPDATLPEGVTVEMIADDLEKMKEDAKFLDVAELRTTILRDAAQNFIMSQPEEDDTSVLPDSVTTQGPVDANIDEQLHAVPEEDTSVLSGQVDEVTVSTAPDAPEVNTTAIFGQKI